MAERFRKLPGPFPGPFPNPFPSFKGLLLFLLPLPVLFAAIRALIGGNLRVLLASTVGYTLFLGGAILARRGMQNQAEYERRKIAHAPRYPLKLSGAILVAAATAITATFAVGYNPANGLCFGLGALLGCYLVYGFDPRTTKRATDSYGLDATDQLLQALAGAEKTLSSIEQSRKNIRNNELRSRLDNIIKLARQVLRTLEENPDSLRRARKFLNVYLDGAQQVTEGYVRTHQQAQSQQLEANFRNVLTTIEDVFKEQQQKLLENDVLDLDIKIEVLSEQLKREGVV
jgi:5-bromo-4-chloroindolyl phosphate hydrolysis protein